MAEDEDSDEGDPSASEPMSTEISSSIDPDYDFMGAGKRALSESEMDAPGFRRYLMADIDRLNRERRGLIQDNKRLVNVDKENAVLKEKLGANTRQRRTNTVVFGVACAGIGLAPSLFGATLAAVAAVLLLACAAFVAGMERL